MHIPTYAGLLSVNVTLLRCIATKLLQKFLFSYGAWILCPSHVVIFVAHMVLAILID